MPLKHTTYSCQSNLSDALENDNSSNENTLRELLQNMRIPIINDECSMFKVFLIMLILLSKKQPLSVNRVHVNCRVSAFACKMGIFFSVLTLYNLLLLFIDPPQAVEEDVTLSVLFYSAIYITTIITISVFVYFWTTVKHHPVLEACGVRRITLQSNRVDRWDPSGNKVSIRNHNENTQYILNRHTNIECTLNSDCVNSEANVQLAESGIILCILSLVAIKQLYNVIGENFKSVYL